MYYWYIQVLSKLPNSSDNLHASRYSRMAGLSQLRPVDHYLNGRQATGITTAERARPRSPTAALELEACCRSNIVTARTRFFEEKSRSASPSTPPSSPHRRFRAVTPRSASDNDVRRQSRSIAGHGGGPPTTPSTGSRLPAARTTHAVPTSAAAQLYQNGQGQPTAASTSYFEPILPVNNAVVVKHKTNSPEVLTYLTISFLNDTMLKPDYVVFHMRLYFR